MSSFATKAIGAVVAGAVAVSAHGHVEGINVNGVYYDGYDPTSYPYMSDPPTVVGWYVTKIVSHSLHRLGANPSIGQPVTLTTATLPPMPTPAATSSATRMPPTQAAMPP